MIEVPMFPFNFMQYVRNQIYLHQIDSKTQRSHMEKITQIMLTDWMLNVEDDCTHQ
jgi:hypothetical protein